MSEQSVPKETVCAIIPARGGSKGIPRKNVRPVAGKPLLAYAIEAARKAPSIGRVFISTDDIEIAEVATTFGAEVIWRPAEISGDFASSEAALLHALGELAESEGYVPEILVFLQCTSPLTLPEDIEGTLAALHDDEAQTALTVTPFHYFLWRDSESGDAGGASGINHDKRRRPLRQERESQFLETGAVYAMRVKGFREARHRFFGKTALFVTPAERCLEIDDHVDLEKAEVMLRARQREYLRTALPKCVEALVLDFDGVFTDNRVLVLQDGREAVTCDRGDGWGIGKLVEAEVPVLVLSREENPVVAARCAKLRIACLQGVRDKIGVLTEWLRERDFDRANVVYVGNDANDVPCLLAMGCGVAVADAYPEAIAAANLVLTRPGGHGAIREIAEYVLRRKEQKP